MVTAASRRLKRISPSELDEVLERARAEQWRDLAVIGPGGSWQPDGIPEEHTFHLRARIGDRIQKLSGLVALSSLVIAYNQIGDEGAQMLVQLAGLSTLDIRGNQIGDEGARALAGLTALTSLDVRRNQIGPEGVRALAKLIGLSSLNVGSNYIGTEGAIALL